MDRCPSEDTLVAYMAGRLEPGVASEVAAHVQSCRACRELLAAVARTESVSQTAGAVVLPTSEPGEIIGRYRVVRAIGAGAMGAVFEAHDPELDRKVALKLVRTSANVQELQTAGRLRVVREAQAMARVSHPNVIHVYEVGTHETCVFIAMELVNGPNLRAWLADKRPAWREIVQVFEQAGAGLEAAHAAGLVHRDFKPDNVLVSRDRRVIVSDFGLARATSSADLPPQSRPAASLRSPGILASPLTQEGALLGTPAYMAPEQMESASVDGRADVFAFSVALYEALYGRRPFAGHTVLQILESARTGQILPTPAKTPVPAEVHRVITRGLAASPEERWPSMGEMVRALHRAAAAGRSGAPRPVVAGAVGVGLLLVATGAWRLRRAESEERERARTPIATRGTPPLAFHPRNTRRITFSEGCECAPRFSPDGKTIIYQAMGTDAHPVFARALDDPTPRQLTPAKTYTFTPTFSPDGRTIAYRRWSRDRPLGLYLMPREGEADAGLLAAGIGNPSWTTDGRSLWGEKTTEYVRVNAANGAVQESFAVPSGYRAGPSLDVGDGTLVTVFPRFDGTTDGGVAVIGKDHAVRWLAHGDFEEALALSPDRRYALAVVSHEGTEPELRSLPLDGSPATTLTGISPRKGIAVSPDGHELVWSTCKDFVSLGRIDVDGKTVDLEPGGSWSDKFVAWLPGRDRLVVLSSRAGTKLEPWIVDPSRHDPPRAIPVGDLDVTGVSPSADGTVLALAAAKKGLALAPADGSAPPRPLTTGPDDHAPSFRHGGKEVLFERPGGAGGGSKIMVARLDGGEPVTLVEGRYPTASPVNDAFVYFAIGAHGEMTAMLFDPKGGARPLSSELPKTVYTGADVSLDGKRAIVIGGGQSLREVDIASGKITWHPPASEGIESIAYTPGGLFVTHVRWAGDLWLADDAF